jgi:hypothetical protein
VGHPHCWDRFLSRRQFVGTSAAAGALLGSRLLMPKLVFAHEDMLAPRPIPGGLPLLQLSGIPDPTIFHVFGVEPGQELSTITDFDGLVGAAEISGTGTGTNTRPGEATKLFFDTDMRFMKGEFIGLDGEEQDGTFGFI